MAETKREVVGIRERDGATVTVKPGTPVSSLYDMRHVGYDFAGIAHTDGGRVKVQLSSDDFDMWKKQQ